MTGRAIGRRSWSPSSGPTASGKSALGLRWPAVRRRNRGLRFDGRLPRLRHRHRQGAGGRAAAASRITCVDIVDPAAEYTAADYARDAMAAIRTIHARGRLPILVGRDGLLLPRADARAVPGPGRDDRRCAARLDAMAARRGAELLHRMLGRVDPPSASRIQPRDRMRLVRALEVYFQTGRTLTDALRRHPLAARGLDHHRVRRAPAVARTSTARIARRVDDQFARGHRRRGARAARGRACRRRARPFTGYVYRQVLEHLRGVRDEARDARADRAREPALRAAPVDLVSQRA